MSFFLNLLKSFKENSLVESFEIVKNIDSSERGFESLGLSNKAKEFFDNLTFEDIENIKKELSELKK